MMGAAADACSRCGAALAPLERRLGYCVDCATHPDVTDPAPKSGVAS